MSDQNTNDGLEQPEEAPNVPLWVQVVFAVILSALVIGWAFVWGTDQIPEGIARAVLDDGTVLVLRQVTTGTTHQMTVEVPDGPWTGTRDEVLDVSDGSHFWGLWLTRHDPHTGHTVEFDEWSHCIAETGEHQVEDTDRRRAILEKGFKPMWSKGSFSGPRNDRDHAFVYQSRLLAKRQGSFPVACIPKRQRGDRRFRSPVSGRHVRVRRLDGRSDSADIDRCRSRSDAGVADE